MASGLRVYIDTNICVIADAYLGLFVQSINFTVECTGGGINNLRIYGAPLQLAPNGSGSPEEDAQKNAVCRRQNLLTFSDHFPLVKLFLVPIGNKQS